MYPPTMRENSAIIRTFIVTVSLLGASGFNPLAAQTKPAAPAKPAAARPAAPPAKPAAPAKPPAQASGAAQGPPATPIAGAPLGPPITPKPGGPLTPYDSTYHVDAIEFQLGPGEYVEYKFRLKTG